MDDRKVLSGIILVIQKGLPWVDAPAAYGPHKTLYNRCRRWSDKDVFDLSSPSGQHPTLQSHPMLQS